ncbi:MAG: hypothetical protein JWQ66_2362 [Mucilaginibacter sp.]|nr:hypothetical protein [Mucilaginibacter sp.]
MVALLAWRRWTHIPSKFTKELKSGADAYDVHYRNMPLKLRF